MNAVISEIYIGCKIAIDHRICIIIYNKNCSPKADFKGPASLSIEPYSICRNFSYEALKIYNMDVHEDDETQQRHKAMLFINRRKMRRLVNFAEFADGILKILNDSDSPAPAEIREKITYVVDKLTVSRSYTAPEALSDGSDKRRLFDALMTVIENPDDKVVDYRTHLAKYLSHNT